MSPFWKSRDRKMAEQVLVSFDEDFREARRLPLAFQRDVARHVRGQIDRFEAAVRGTSPGVFTETLQRFVGTATAERQAAVPAAYVSGERANNPDWLKHALEEGYFIALFLSAKEDVAFRYMHPILVRWTDELLS